MTLLIVLAIVWAFVGVPLPVPFTRYRLGTTYVTEVVAFTAFGVAWMASSKDLRIFRAHRRPAYQEPVTVGLHR